MRTAPSIEQETLKGELMAHPLGWLCDVCSKEYTTQSDAEDCEQKHMVLSMCYGRYRAGEAYPYELAIVLEGDYHSEDFSIPFPKRR